MPNFYLKLGSNSFFFLLFLSTIAVSGKVSRMNTMSIIVERVVSSASAYSGFTIASFSTKQQPVVMLR